MAIELAPKTFEPEKAIAAIAYLAERAKTTLYPVMKMMYLADRMHLERYGRFIAGDAYVAMPEGPVPKGSYNLVKAARGEKLAVPGCEQAMEVFACGADHALRVRIAVDYDELSRSDIECLDWALDHMKRNGKDVVVKDAYDAAWEKVRGMHPGKAPAMSIAAIAATFANPKPLLSHLCDPNPGSAN